MSHRPSPPAQPPGPQACGPGQIWLRLRLRERPGALERALGVLRRQHSDPARLHVASTDDGLEVVALLRSGRVTPDRLRRELAALTDATDIELLTHL